MVNSDQAHTSRKKSRGWCLPHKACSRAVGASQHGWSFLAGRVALGWTKTQDARKALTALLSLCGGFLRSTCKCVGASLPPKKDPCCAIFQRACPVVPETGNARALHALASLLEHVDFGVRPKSLVKHHRAGLEEVAFDARVACDGVSH